MSKWRPARLELRPHFPRRLDVFYLEDPPLPLPSAAVHIMLRRPSFSSTRGTSLPTNGHYDARSDLSGFYPELLNFLLNLL